MFSVNNISREKGRHTDRKADRWAETDKTFSTLSFAKGKVLCLKDGRLQLLIIVVLDSSVICFTRLLVRVKLKNETNSPWCLRLAQQTSKKKDLS